MRRKIAALAAAGTMGVAGITAVAVGVPLDASAATPASSATAGTTATTVDEEATPEPGSRAAEFLAERVVALRDALAGLVEDETITQEQADRVAESLAESDALRPHGRGHGPGGLGGPGGLDRPGGHAGHGRFGGHGFGFGGLGGHGFGFGGGVALEAAAEALGLEVEELGAALRHGSTLSELAEQEGVEVSALVDALVAAAEDRLHAAVADERLTEAEAEELRGDLRERIEGLVDAELVGPGHRFGRHGRDDDGSAEEATPTPDGEAGAATRPSSYAPRSGTVVPL